VIGYIDGVVDGKVSGWACHRNYPCPIEVHAYLSGSTTIAAADYVGSFEANSPSESAVATACGSTGTAYRFSFPLPAQHAGKWIHLFGIAKKNANKNKALTLSGAFKVPPYPPISIDLKSSTWINTGISVIRGKSLNISVQGSAFLCARNTCPTGPAGRGDNGLPQCKIVQNLSPGAVIGKIGENGAPFLVGTQFNTTQASASGPLYLGHNDAPCSGDNNGAFSATVSVGQ